MIGAETASRSLPWLYVAKPYSGDRQVRGGVRIQGDQSASAVPARFSGDRAVAFMAARRPLERERPATRGQDGREVPAFAPRSIQSQLAICVRSLGIPPA